MFRLRQAKAADAAAIAKIIARNFDETMPEHSAAAKEECKSKSTEADILEQLAWKLVFVIERDNSEIIATGGLADFGTPEAHFYSISNLFVKPEMHRQGFGDVIINHLLYLTEQKKAEQLHVPSSLTAIKFYEKYDFVKDEKQPPEDQKLEITWMTRKLR